MSDKFTMTQLHVIKKMTELAEAFATQVYHIMENHGLDQIQGCALKVCVTPEFKYTTRDIILGTVDSDFGSCNIARGKDEDYYTVYGKNSPIYELLFCDPKIKAEMEKCVNKPIPPDGLWVGGDYKGEW